MGYQREIEEVELDLSVKVKIKVRVPIAHLPEFAQHELLGGDGARDAQDAREEQATECPTRVTTAEQPGDVFDQYGEYYC